VKLGFTWRALDELERLHAFIAKENPQAARRISQARRRSIQLLTEQPHMGQTLPTAPGVRRWIAGPYVVHYVIDGEQLTVLRIWHGREQRAEESAG
jgi:plasmid stabilization system protein ParE